MCDMFFMIGNFRSLAVDKEYQRLRTYIKSQRDGWGFLGITNNNRVVKFKTLKHEYFEEVLYSKLLKYNEWKFFGVHGRIASAGTVNLRNVMPIWNKDIALFFNGTMDLPTIDGGSDVWTVMYMITGALSWRISRETVFKDVVRKIEGGALALIDLRNLKMYFRNGYLMNYEVIQRDGYIVVDKHTAGENFDFFVLDIGTMEYEEFEEKSVRTAYGGYYYQTFDRWKTI